MDPIKTDRQATRLEGQLDVGVEASVALLSDRRSETGKHPSSVAELGNLAMTN